MGCQAVSVYADESNGMLGYPEPIITDLYNRNYSAGNLLKAVPTTHPYYVLGFGQSYAEARLFTYVLNGRELFVYGSGRYLVVGACPGAGKKGDLKMAEHENSQRAIMHEDKIVGIDAKGKLCLSMHRNST